MNALPLGNDPRARPRWRAQRWLAAVVLLVASTPALAHAQDRRARVLASDDGLLPPVIALAQDSTGFIWVGTRAGLFRYDGDRFHRWATDVAPGAVGSVAVSSTGRTIAIDMAGRILELSRGGARVLPGEARHSPDFTNVAAFDEADRLWIVTPAGGVAWQREDGAWQHIGSEELAGADVQKIFSAGPAGGVLVADRTGLWRARAGAAPERLRDAAGLIDGYRFVDARVLADGSVIALANNRRVILIRDGRFAGSVEWVTPVTLSRAISIAERGGTLWMATDHYLIAFTPTGAPEVRSTLQGVHTGGPLLVDREGSLWHGGYTALTQYPEPETRIWDERHGLPSTHARYVAISDDAVWVPTWRGAAYLTAGVPSAPIRQPAGWAGPNRFCPDRDGALWTGTETGLRRVVGTDATVHDPAGNVGFFTCAPASDGGIWIGSSAGLVHLPPDGGTLRRMTSFPHAGDISVEAAYEDASGRVWAASRLLVCSAPARDLIGSGVAEWSCTHLPAGAVHATSILEPRAGELWVATNARGVFRRRGDRWEPVPASAELPTQAVLSLVPSRRGGVWVVGSGFVQRVEARGEARGWEVVERPGAWHGMPVPGAGDVAEDDDGGLWLATARGLVHIPGHVRSAIVPPPPTALVEATVDGQPLDLSDALTLPHDRNRLALRFTALSFRDPGSIRYQVRLSPGHEWTDVGGDPAFHWVDLPPGDYRPEVRASLDGTNWTREPAALAFTVEPAWYRTAWALTLFGLLAAGLLLGLYRARLAYLLGLERQRTRIAMDLHDEMGSGLASIGILAGVLSHGREAERERIANEVATTAEELGAALSDIVWSLDPQSATLEELAARLAEHGGRLFADDVRFDTEFPDDWPPLPLPLPVLRNVLLIGLEALHNAARHAGAHHVVLALRPDRDEWLLDVRDDGAGVTDRSPTGGARGRGLRTMRRRATEIGGDVAWHERASGGTIVRLRFTLRSRRSRLWRLLRRNAAAIEPNAPREQFHPATQQDRPTPQRHPHEHAGAQRDAPSHR